MSEGKIKVISPARQLADIAAEYFRPSGVPKSYANDAVEVHAVNLERRLNEAVDELITSRDFVIGEMVKALEAINTLEVPRDTFALMQWIRKARTIAEAALTRSREG